MSRIVIVILIYHRHKPIDLVPCALPANTDLTENTQEPTSNLHQYVQETRRLKPSASFTLQFS
jgi:hypothetical protein